MTTSPNSHGALRCVAFFPQHSQKRRRMSHVRCLSPHQNHNCLARLTTRRPAARLGRLGGPDGGAGRCRCLPPVPPPADVPHRLQRGAINRTLRLPVGLSPGLYYPLRQAAVCGSPLRPRAAAAPVRDVRAATARVRQERVAFGTDKSRAAETHLADGPSCSGVGGVSLAVRCSPPADLRCREQQLPLFGYRPLMNSNP